MNGEKRASGMVDIRAFFERVDPGCRVPRADVTLVAGAVGANVRLGVTTMLAPVSNSNRKSQLREKRTGIARRVRVLSAHRDCLNFSLRKSVDHASKSALQIAEGGLEFAAPSPVQITPPISFN